MAEVADIWGRGYLLSLDRVAPGIGGVNVLLLRIEGTQPMATSISSSSDFITRNHERLVQYIRNGVDRHLGQAA